MNKTMNRFSPEIREWAVPMTREVFNHGGKTTQAFQTATAAS